MDHRQFRREDYDSEPTRWWWNELVAIFTSLNHSNNRQTQIVQSTNFRNL